MGLLSTDLIYSSIYFYSYYGKELSGIRVAVYSEFSITGGHSRSVSDNVGSWFLLNA